MWEKGVIEWHHSIINPLDSMGFVLVTQSCRLHICVLYAYGICNFCVCMVVAMVLMVSPCESGWCVVGCGRHECTSVMHWLYMLVLIYCYAYMIWLYLSCMRSWYVVGMIRH